MVNTGNLMKSRLLRAPSCGDRGRASDAMGQSRDAALAHASAAYSRIWNKQIRKTLQLKYNNSTNEYASKYANFGILRFRSNYMKIVSKQLRKLLNKTLKLKIIACSSCGEIGEFKVMECD